MTEDNYRKSSAHSRWRSLPEWVKVALVGLLVTLIAVSFFRLADLRIGQVRPMPTYANEVRQFSLPRGGSVEMVYVQAGVFTMGSEDGDEDERPVHEVYLGDFWIDLTEVTNFQYDQCVADGVCDASIYSDDVDFNGTNQPVVGVDWNEAVEYCEWRNARLPTEAEWEKAARAADERTYPWGEGINCDLANQSKCEHGTVDVGSYADGASPYGVLDMGGNVWEWVNDWYEADYYVRSVTESGSTTENPVGPESSEWKVLRGGSWLVDEGYVRAAGRLSFRPGVRNTGVGFRCANSS